MGKSTNKTEEVLDFIKKYKRENQGNSPTLEEISDGCGLSGRPNAKYHINVLQEEGRITYGGTRFIIICDPMEVTA